jgi:hypothetical protein
MAEYIDLKKLNLDELVGVVNLYPWFGAARKELCARMSSMGEGWGDAQYAEAAMYVVARERIADLKRDSKTSDLTDADVEGLLKLYIGKVDEAQVVSQTAVEREERKVYAVGGDYFSQSDYEQVKHSDDNVFSRYAAKARQEAPTEAEKASHEISFYTETLAQIYAEQGYYEQSKDIYSKLILAYPEKSAYFASLIEKIDKINS